MTLDSSKIKPAVQRNEHCFSINSLQEGIFGIIKAGSRNRYISFEDRFNQQWCPLVIPVSGQYGKLRTSWLQKDLHDVHRVLCLPHTAIVANTVDYRPRVTVAERKGFTAPRAVCYSETPLRSRLPSISPSHVSSHQGRILNQQCHLGCMLRHSG